MLPKRQINLIFVGLLIAMLLGSLDQMIFSTALPTIVGELDGVDHMLWVTTAYVVAVTIMMPIYGKLGDLIGRKSLILGAISIFMIGSVVGGLASDMTWLITGRAVQGLGGGGLMILAQAVIADIVPPKDRGRYMGPMGAVFGLAAVLGPILGGWFTEGIGWRWAFWINIPLGVLALVSILIFLKLPHRDFTRPRLDVAGISVMAIFVTCLVLFTSWGGKDYEWDSPMILGLIAATVVSGVLFLFVEKRAAEPIIPLYLFRDRNFNLSTIAGLIAGVVMFGAIGYLPTYLQMVHSLNATESGLLLLPMVAGMLVSGIVSGQLASRTAHYKWMPIASMLITAVAMVLLSTLTIETELWVVGLFIGIFGLGLGLGMQILVLIVQNSFPVSQVGTATASNNFFREIGATLGAAIVGSLFTTRLGELLAERMPVVPEGSGATAPEANSLTPALVRDLPDMFRTPIIESYNDSMTPIFLYLLPLLIVAAVALIFVIEKPLETTLTYGEDAAVAGAAGTNDGAEAEGITEADALPGDTESVGAGTASDAGRRAEQ
ncbi:EmrB/QacA subfamily drug resistance transporter [Klugiella xanthotipulae]|uniref:EmrB/QacA subfamily drug resistance transporter n=2 Tax=Klugiella xanthotipulae TaxID=244735 RepID=A0A543HY67_9MICO|nr:EmrB/QacA subfamily drug resistance transporter [Klugiella xanthotipulae]